MSAIVSPGVLPAQDDNKSKPRQSKTDLSLGEEPFIQGCWHRNAAKAVRNHGGGGVKGDDASLAVFRLPPEPAAWRDRFRTLHRSATVHVGANLRALRFWRQNGFRDLDPEGRAGGRTVWMGRS